MVHVMACCLFGAKLLTKPGLTSFQLDIEKHIQIRLYSGYELNIFIQEIASENIPCSGSLFVQAPLC